MEIGNFLKLKKSENEMDLGSNSDLVTYKFSQSPWKKQKKDNSNAYTINSSIMVNPSEKNSKTSLSLRIPITQLEKFKMLTKSTKSNKFPYNQQNLNGESTIKPSSSNLDKFPNLNKYPIKNSKKTSSNKDFSDLFLNQSSKFFPYNEEKYSSKKISQYKNFTQDRDRIYLTKTIQKNKTLSEELTKFNQNIKKENIPKTFSFSNHPSNKIKSNSSKYDNKNEEGNFVNFNIPFTEKKARKFHTDVAKLPLGNIDDNLKKLRSSSSNRVIHNFKNQISMNDYLIKNFNIGSQEVKNTNSK